MTNIDQIKNTNNILIDLINKTNKKTYIEIKRQLKTNKTFFERFKY